MNGIDNCLAHNARYAAQFAAGDLPTPPRLPLAILTCMDARLETGRMLGIGEGDAHVIRNAGGIVTEDAVRSLSLSQAVLGTREIMVIQHTDCGLSNTTDAALTEQVYEETGVRPDFTLGAFGDVDTSVRNATASLRRHPLIPHRNAIRGFVYDVVTGKLREISVGVASRGE